MNLHQKLKMSEQPKKPQRNTRAKKLNLNIRKKWQSIIEDVDKKELPVSVLDYISVQLVDGTNVTISVKELLKNGQTTEDVEMMLDDKFIQLDQYIVNVDFFVDVEKVQDAIQPETDKVLKGL